MGGGSPEQEVPSRRPRGEQRLHESAIVSGSGPAAVFGLPAYNGEAYLAEALESLLGQTRPDLAVVVVDDGSTDGTGAIARQYAQLDGRVEYIRNERTLGLGRNWRRAAELARERHPAARYF